MTETLTSLDRQTFPIDNEVLYQVSFSLFLFLSLSPPIPRRRIKHRGKLITRYEIEYLSHRRMSVGGIVGGRARRDKDTGKGRETAGSDDLEITRRLARQEEPSLFRSSFPSPCSPLRSYNENDSPDVACV